MWSGEPQILRSIWDLVMTTYDKKDIPKEKIWQFYIKSIAVVIGSRVMYGRGKGRKEGVVLGMDPANTTKSKRYVTVEFPGDNRRTVPYNSCTMVGFETLTPIEFDLYHLLNAEYKYRNRTDKVWDGKLNHMIAPHYNIKEVGGVLFAYDPMKPEDRPKKVDTTEGLIPQPRNTKYDVENFENPIEMIRRNDPGVMPGTSAGKEVQVETKLPITIKDEKILLTIPLETIKKQLFSQGYKLTKL